MRFVWSIVVCVMGLLAVVGCSSGGNSDPIAGIEIGNPALALTADFSVDYSEVEKNALLKVSKCFIAFPLPENIFGHAVYLL